MTVRRPEWTGYFWLCLLTAIPFFLESGRLVRDSLSDVPEAYLICIPVITLIWVGMMLHHGSISQTRIMAAPILVILIGAVTAVMGWLFWDQVVGAGSNRALLFWPIWLALVVWVLYGGRALPGVVKPVLYLFLGWPPLFVAIINRFNPFLERVAFFLLRIVSQWARWLKNVHPGLYLVTHAGRSHLISVTAACSGSDGILALLVIFPVALFFFESSLVQKVLVIGVGCLLAFVANILRIIAIMATVRYLGWYWGFKIVHPLLGPVLFILLVGVLLSYRGFTVRSGGAYHPHLVVWRRVPWMIPVSIGLALVLAWSFTPTGI